jgi:hypothetical protein
MDPAIVAALIIAGATLLAAWIGSHPRGRRRGGTGASEGQKSDNQHVAESEKPINEDHNPPPTGSSPN